MKPDLRRAADLDRAAQLVLATIDGALHGEPAALAVLRSPRWLDWCAALRWDGHGLRRLTERRAADEIAHADALERGRSVVARLVRWRGERRALEVLYWHRQMTDREIAALWGCDSATICRMRQRYRVGARPPGNTMTRHAARAAA